MDKYAEIEKLADLVQKGLLTESEYQVEKQKLLNDNQSSDTSASITDCELKRIKDYDDNFLTAKQLKENGQYSGIYLAVAFFSLIFGSLLDASMRNLSYLVSLPAVFVLPIYLMRMKKMRAAHAESSVILSKLSSIELEINLLREKNKLNEIPNRRNLRLVLSVSLLVGFFLPLLSFNGMSTNSLILLEKFAQDDPSIYLLTIAPVLAFLSVIKLAKPDFIPLPKTLPLLAGLSPYFLLGLMYFLHSNEFNNLVSTITNAKKYGTTLNFGAGAYIIAISSTLLVNYSLKNK